MSAPAATIVIPVFNRADLLDRCLRALDKTARHDEIVVSDDGSTEDIGQVVARHNQRGNIRHVRSDENRGFACACNVGVGAATGDVVVFLNSDTIPSEPGWLDALLDALDDPEVGLVGALLWYPGKPQRAQHAGAGFTAQKSPLHLYRGMTKREAPGILIGKRLQWVTGACMALRTEDLRMLGGFDESYRNGGEDLDLCFRVRLGLGLAVLYEPRAQMVHLEGQSDGRFDHESANARRFFDRWEHAIQPDLMRIMEADGGLRT